MREKLSSGLILLGTILLSKYFDYRKIQLETIVFDAKLGNVGDAISVLIGGVLILFFIFLLIQIIVTVLDRVRFNLEQLLKITVLDLGIATTLTVALQVFISLDIFAQGNYETRLILSGVILGIGIWFFTKN